MTIIAIKKETIKPVAITSQPESEMPPPTLTSLSKAAPNIVGMARKKENSAAADLDKPSKSPPIIVAAERDVPGTIARH